MIHDKAEGMRKIKQRDSLWENPFY